MGGFLGGTSADSSATMTTSDARKRAVSANILNDIAEETAYSAMVFSRSESPDLMNLDAVVKSLLAFALDDATKITARIERREQGQMAIVAGSYQRTLNADQVKLLLESAPKSELSLSGKDQMDCSMMKTAATGGAAAGPATAEGGKQCGSDRQLAGKYDNSIKWQKEGSDWVPTTVDLYVVDTQQLRSRAAVSIENAIVTSRTESQIHNLKHITTAQPTDYLVDLINQKVEGLVARMDGPKKTAIRLNPGLYRTISYWAGGAAHQNNWCQPVVANPGTAFELIGGQDTAVHDGRRSPLNVGPSLGCRPGGHCDSAGEFCVSYHRALGCYVNKDWLGWYRQRKAAVSAPVVIEEVCAPPL